MKFQLSYEVVALYDSYEQQLILVHTFNSVPNTTHQQTPFSKPTITGNSEDSCQMICLQDS
jgi:hypothetical protein